jgi:hypothetical protein
MFFFPRLAMNKNCPPQVDVRRMVPQEELSRPGRHDRHAPRSRALSAVTSSSGPVTSGTSRKARHGPLPLRKGRFGLPSHKGGNDSVTSATSGHFLAERSIATS